MRRCVLMFVCLLISSFSLSQGKETQIKLSQDSARSFINEAKFGSVAEIANRTLKESLRLKNDSLIANSYNLLGIAYGELKDEKSIDYLKKALEYYKKAHKDDKALLVMNNIGVLYIKNKKLEESLIYFKDVLQAAKKFKDTKILIHPLYNIGYLNSRLGNYKEALSSLNKALILCDTIHNVRSLSDIYSSLGYTHFKLKDLNKSEYFYKKAIEISKNNNFLHALYIIYNERSNLFVEIKAYEKAVENLLLEKAIINQMNVMREYELKEEIEAEYLIKADKEKLEYFIKEKQVENKLLKQSRNYNIILSILIFLLLLSFYFIYKKNRKIRIETKKAQSLAIKKSTFYSEISHELRTPLFAVIQLTNFLMQENPKKYQKDYLSSLKFSADHLLSLINNVLELNKMDSSYAKVDAIEFNLKELIAQVIDSVDYSLSQKKCEMVLHYDDTIPEKIIGDKLKITQIVTNLLSNAIKYTDEGTITLTIKQISETPKAVSIYFEFKDTGIGIPLEKQKDIFKDYFQDSSTNKNSLKGFGLGLFIVKKTLQSLGSDIALVSQPGVGSNFNFELEFKKYESDIHVENNSKTNEELMAAFNFLIIDDNKINLLITKKIIENYKATCDICISGEEGIEKIRVNSYDCILLDISMFGLDGYETITIIRSFNKNIPVIAFTATQNENVIDKIKQAGFDNIITKPFSNAKFVQTILDTIQNKQKRT